jgi:hypothetical protein
MGDELQKQLDDHESRIRILEKNSTEMKFNLLSIEKSQSDLKLMVSESNKTLSILLNKFVDSELGVKKFAQKNSWNMAFKLWAVVGPVITAAAAYLFRR